MPLTPEQEQQLAELEAEKNAPEPRTQTGVKGVLHALLDVVSGRVPHLSDEQWDTLHKQAEGQDDSQAPADAAQPDSNPAEPPGPAGN